MTQLDHPNGSTHDYIIWALSKAATSQEHILAELNRFHDRMEYGEQRMDFLAEENIRRQAEIAAAREASVKSAHSESHAGSSTERMILAALAFVKDVLGERRDVWRWLILLGLAWGANKLHLSQEWHDTLLQHANGPSE